MKKIKKLPFKLIHLTYFILFSVFFLFLVILFKFSIIDINKTKIKTFVNEFKSKPIETTNKNTIQKINTSTQTLLVTELNKNFDHIEIYKESSDEINLIALKGNDVTNAMKRIPLEVFDININIKDKTFSEKLIFTEENNYRATDILVLDSKKIFISQVEDNQKDQIRLIAYELVKNNGIYTRKFIYESQFASPPTAVHTTGGKMIEIDNNKILLSVGTFLKNNQVNDDYDFGKMIMIDLETKNKFIYSSGHRNSQGLSISKINSQIIETEHGPQGGDEINIIIEGENYGWPYETYGVPYNSNPESINWNYGGVEYGKHDKFRKPVYAFVPSIGIKAIEQLPLNQYEFPKWDNNYLLCSTRGLFLVRFVGLNDNRDPRVVLTEWVGDGCRDIKITSKGVIITNDIRIIEREKDFERG